MKNHTRFPLVPYPDHLHKTEDVQFFLARQNVATLRAVAEMLEGLEQRHLTWSETFPQSVFEHQGKLERFAEAVTELAAELRAAAEAV